MSARTDTRDVILKTAGHLLQTRGFNGFSYAHIAEALDIKTAAVHYHFPSKTDLGLALLEKYRGRYQRWMTDAAGQPPWIVLEGFFSIYAHFLKDGMKACPCGVLQAELMAIPDEMQAATRAMTKEVVGWLAGVLEEGRGKGHFKFEGEPQDKAFLVMATVQGALQVARSLGREAFHASIRQLKHDLGG